MSLQQREPRHNPDSTTHPPTTVLGHLGTEGQP
jgi:hypothetical protein